METKTIKIDGKNFTVKKEFNVKSNVAINDDVILAMPGDVWLQRIDENEKVIDLFVRKADLPNPAAPADEAKGKGK